MGELTEKQIALAVANAASIGSVFPGMRAVYDDMSAIAHELLAARKRIAELEGTIAGCMEHRYPLAACAECMRHKAVLLEVLKAAREAKR